MSYFDTLTRQEFLEQGFSSTGIYRTKRNCPDCGAPEEQEGFQKKEEGYGWHHGTVFSCKHYKKRVDDSPCKYCGKINTPVRQVPASVPISDCYCDDCADKCAAEYSALNPFPSKPGAR